MLELSVKPEHQDPSILFQDRNTSIHFSRGPRIPIEQGVDFIVENRTPQKKTVKALLHNLLIGLGAAKVIAESGITPDAWANTRIDMNDEVHVFGRNPENDESWRRPVPSGRSRQLRMERVDQMYPIKKMQTLFGKFMPVWQRLSAVVHPFADEKRFIGHDIGIAEYSDREGAIKIWESEHVVLEIMVDRHLNGYHFIASPKEAFARQWQTKPAKTRQVKLGMVNQQPNIERTIETFAILLGVQELMGMHGEIHNSGNWAAGLKHAPAGNFSLIGFHHDQHMFSEETGKRIYAKGEKRAHRQDIVKKYPTTEGLFDFGTSMHTHLYIPFDREVVLPYASRTEVQEDYGKSTTGTKEHSRALSALQLWASIRLLSREEFTFAIDHLAHGKLSEWLGEHVPRDISF